MTRLREASLGHPALSIHRFLIHSYILDMITNFG